MMTCILSHRHALAFHLNLLLLGKRKHANGIKHQTLPQMGATRPKAAEKISFMFENTWDKIIDWFHE